jgi:hypothetical protein
MLNERFLLINPEAASLFMLEHSRLADDHRTLHGLFEREKQALLQAVAVGEQATAEIMQGRLEILLKKLQELSEKAVKLQIKMQLVETIALPDLTRVN